MSSDPTALGVLTLLLALLAVVASVGLRVLALGIIPGRRKPSTGMAWLLLVLTWPTLGLLLFGLFGSTRIGRRRAERHRAANEEIARRTQHLPRPLDERHVPDYLRSVARLNRRLGALSVLPGNSVRLESDTRAAVVAMAAAVDEAVEEVLVEFYITAWDDVTGVLFDALVRATERGVRVRLLFDHLGSRGIPGYQEMLTRLDATDIAWRPMLPISLRRRTFRRPDLRNHRKILVVDRAVAWTGSANLIEPGYGKPAHHEAGRAWVDLVAEVQGPTVTALAAVFASDWYVETGDRIDLETVEAPAPRPGASTDVLAQVVPSGPGFVAENNLRMFTTLVYGATRRLSLTSPYFVPDESLLYAVTTAAQRGVDVELFVSEVSDQFMVGHAQASYYRALLEAGVRIHLYPAPLVLHSKHLTVDDDVAVIGSSNMDMRSFALNYEVSVMLLGGDVVARVREVEDTYRALSRELLLAEWEQRGRGQRWLDNVMRLTAALQ